MWYFGYFFIHHTTETFRLKYRLFRLSCITRRASLSNLRLENLLHWLFLAQFSALITKMRIAFPENQLRLR